MCLAFPMKIMNKRGRLALAKSGSIQHNVYLDLLPSAKVGDYILVHAGFAIEKVDLKRAKEIFEIIDTLK